MIQQPGHYTATIEPSDAATLLAWWKTDDLALADGASVTSWPDASGHGRTLSPYTAAKPVYKAAVQNGRGVVRFAGTTDVLQFAQTGALAEWTVFVVCGGLNVATNSISYCVAFTGGGTHVGGNNSTHGNLGQFQDGTKYLNASVKPTAWGIDCWTLGHIYRDNVEVSYSARVGVMDRMNFTDLGGRNDVSNLGVIGDIGEVLVYSGTLSDSDRGVVHAYLKNRWGTP